MNLWQVLKIAVRALLRNKLRSFLTVLGIIIGVAAVIAMVAIGEGAKSRVESAFASMGTNMLIVLPGSNTASGARGGYGSQPTVTWDDVQAMRDLPAVKDVAPLLRSNHQLSSVDQNWFTAVQGTTPAYFSIRSWSTDSGALFTDADVEGGAKVVLLGGTVADQLFAPGVDPVGQAVRIKNVPFTVVGVLARKGQSPMGQDYDDTAFVPVTSYMTKVKGGLKRYLDGTVVVSATSARDTARAQDEVTALLRDRHHVAVGADDDFSVRNLAEIANAQQQGTQTLTALLASIAGVSLLVGGIGIMNIMLVSVTERTREIGLRMAIGAKPRDIRTQFLVEAVALSAAGGLIGLALGVGVAEDLASQLKWPILIRPDIAALAIGFSALVGVGFGFYPARKASLLDPIEALRYEA